MALPERAQALLDFWFGAAGDPMRGENREIWFRSTPEFDDELRQRFEADYRDAAARRLAAWEATPLSTLALLLLLDQIPRNIFRDSAQAYATDPLAREVAKRALSCRFDRDLPVNWRKFVFMPLHHSENLADQQRSAELFAALPRDGEPEDRRGGLRRYGLPYLEVIERFGRFPHRNAILGRPSTREEIAFLEQRKNCS